MELWIIELTLHLLGIVLTVNQWLYYLELQYMEPFQARQVNIMESVISAIMVTGRFMLILDLTFLTFYNKNQFIYNIVMQ